MTSSCKCPINVRQSETPLFQFETRKTRKQETRKTRKQENKKKQKREKREKAPSWICCCNKSHEMIEEFTWKRNTE